MSPSLTFNPGNSENQMNRALWVWVLEKAWEIDTKLLQEKRRVWFNLNLATLTQRDYSNILPEAS